MSNTPFFLVCNSRTYSATGPHHTTFRAAEAEARRNASRELGQSFVVLQAVAMVLSTQPLPTTTILDDRDDEDDVPTYEMVNGSIACLG